MKRITIFLTIVGGIIPFRSQTIVWNEMLFSQIAKNQTVRLASNQNLFNSYNKQNEMYNKINQKVAQIVAIQSFIYSNLYNVNSAILQGKQLYYIYKRFEEIGQTAAIVLNYTVTKPQYAVLLYNYYADIVTQLTQLKKQLVEEILKEDNDFLMDSADRSALVEIIRVRTNLLYGNLLTIKWTLEAAKETPYIYQIPIIRDYVNMDRAIVRDVIQKWQWIY